MREMRKKQAQTRLKSKNKQQIISKNLNSSSHAANSEDFADPGKGFADRLPMEFAAPDLCPLYFIEVDGRDRRVAGQFDSVVPVGDGRVENSEAKSDAHGAWKV